MQQPKYIFEKQPPKDGRRAVAAGKRAGPGDTVRVSGGREYYIAPDGSWRRRVKRVEVT